MGDLSRFGGIPGNWLQCSSGVFSKNVGADLDTFLDFRAQSDGVDMW